MSINKEQLEYIERLLSAKERTAQPLERIYINNLRKDLSKLGSSGGRKNDNAKR